MNQQSTYLVLSPPDSPASAIVAVTWVAELSRKNWDRVFFDRAGGVVSGALPEPVKNRRQRNLAHSYWCHMVVLN